MKKEMSGNEGESEGRARAPLLASRLSSHFSSSPPLPARAPHDPQTPPTRAQPCSPPCSVAAWGPPRRPPGPARRPPAGAAVRFFFLQCHTFPRQGRGRNEKEESERLAASFMWRPTGHPPPMHDPLQSPVGEGVAWLAAWCDPVAVSRAR